MLSTGALLDLLTEVIAKGGNLLLNVGPSVDGTVPELQQRPLRDVGAWVTKHADVVHGSRPFDDWGDAQVRYVRVGEEVLAIDLAAGAELTLAAVTPDRYEVAGIDADDGGAIHWEQYNGGVTISRVDRSPAGLAGVYRLRLREAPQAIRLFDEREAFSRPVQPLLDGASPGDVVQLHDGRFQGPVTVPRGVTLRGMGWDRTSVLGGGQTAVTLQSGARIENIHMLDGPARFWMFAAPIVVMRGAGATVSGCKLDGHAIIEGDDAEIRATIGIGVIGAVGAERVRIERCALKGMRWDVGIQLEGGSGHVINRNEIVEHLCNIRLRDCNAATVSENRLEGRWWGVHLAGCDGVEVVDNTMQHTMRAVNVEGGSGCVVTGNWVADGDSGALIEFGATETAVIDNHVERCRLGVLVWDAPTTGIGPNTFVDLHEEQPIVRGPDADAD
jgi:alpha-L-fucosidase